MAEMKLTNRQNGVDLSQENLFELQCLIKANNIHHAARSEFHNRQFLAFVSGASDLGLYYLKDSTCLPVIKKVPWFQSSRKKIACLCFDPSGSWLLVASVDGSLYIVPAKTLVDDFYLTDQKWTTKDVTSFSSLNAQNSYSRPSSLAWWQGSSFAGQTGIIGTEQGELIFVNLETGEQVGTTKIEGRVTNLSICQDTELDTVTLLITSHFKEQWYLVLEEPGGNYIFPLSSGGSQRSPAHTEEADNDDSKTFPTARSRLRGLKQLSVEKLVILKQKLAESRNRNAETSGARPDNSNNENNCESGSNDNENSNETSLFYNKKQIKCSTFPVAIPNDIFITPQRLKNNQTIYTRYVPSLNHLMIHERNTSLSPSHVHKVPEQCESILLTSRFFYISDSRHRFVYVVSRPLSEVRKVDRSDLNRDSIVARFSFDKSEEIINSIYTLPSTRNDGDFTSGNSENKTYNIAKDITDLKVHIPPVDTCIVVTNMGIYKIILREHILPLFMDLILRRRAVEDATKLGLIFGLNVQQLVEYAGDMILCNRQFSRALELYSLAGCRLSKSILKFASVGYTTELLNCLVSYSTTSAVSELSEPNRIHFSNLSVLAFTELALRATGSQNKTIHKDYLNFLSTNTFYDELFAINIAVQTNMWNVLHHLVVRRGLGPQVLDILVKALPTFVSKSSNLGQQHNINGLLMCLSDSSLIQGMLNNPSTARNHISFILANLSSLQIYVLQRLITLYDPTNAAIRPLLLRFKARRRAASRSSYSSQCGSLDLSEDLDESGVLIEEMTEEIIEEVIEVFLQTLLTVLHKKQPGIKFVSKYVPFTQLSDIVERREKGVSVDFKRRLLSTGFAHTALIRNGNVYTWGSTLQGCLGTGPTISRYSSPQGICIFRRLGIEVLSISCGRCHTLAVTNNGVYSWGGNKYGQLGLGEMRECPNPELITSLSQEIIVEAVAGQHHSVALTADGRLFTWGWGVHGQLGHGSIEVKRRPTLVTALLGVVARHASAGYAHTLVLSADGYVYAFGCNLFGQLGLGSEGKCTSPVKINLLPERITLISTKYFHNLAISCTNQLYVWGSNPQVLRLQWKERKVRLHKAKLAMQEAMEREALERDAINGEASEESEDTNDNDKPRAASNDNNDNEKPSTRLTFPEIEPVEESQTHMVPELVDTSLVYGKIVQISTGYHHSALLTKDGTIYTWGRNLDRQLGTGDNRDVHIPTPLFYQAMTLLNEKVQRVRNRRAQANEDSSNANNELNPDSYADFDANQKDRSRLIKAVKICCGSNFTVAIQPGGNVLAWGSNNFAQLGRAPANPKEEEKVIFKFKSSKRVIRCFNHSDRYSVIDTTPNQVPNIPTPTISYQSYDVTPLAGSVRPLTYIESNFSDLTLHYALEQFHGLYSSFKIINKCSELKNYQACAKLELLEHNFVEALTYQFKALKECDPVHLETFTNGVSMEDLAEDSKSIDILQENSKLFEKHLERNLVETMIESVKKQKVKMPVSKSLDSFQVIEEELHTFDDQGGSEELFEDSKYDGVSVEMTLEESLEHDNKEDKDSLLSSIENSISHEEVDNDDSSCTNYDRLSNGKGKCADGNALSQHDLTVMKHAVNIVDFYLYEVEGDAYTSTYEISATAINFWVENKFPIEELEKVFCKYMKKIYYSLSLLLYGQNDAQTCSTSEKSEKNIRVKNPTKILSTGFCLKVCSLLLEHIDEDKPVSEYIELLSMSMAKNYGPPLTGYPGSSENKTPEQMIDGIISTLSAKYYDPRPFIHIKDPDKVSELLSADEDSMIFTCGHQYLVSAYRSEVIPRMETDLLTMPTPLPATAQNLGTFLYRSYKPETLCPLCLSQVLKDVAKDVADR